MRTYNIHYYNQWSGWQDVQMKADSLSNLRARIIKEGLALSKSDAPQPVTVKVTEGCVVKRLGRIECVNPWTGEYVWANNSMRRAILPKSGDLKRRC